MEARPTGLSVCPAFPAAFLMVPGMLKNYSAIPELVRDLMTVGVATCSPDTPAGDIARLLLEKSLEAVVVLEPSDGHALGYVSQEELVRAYANYRESVGEMTAEQVMKEEVPQVPADIPIAAASQLMLDRGVRVLFLMHHSGGIEYPAALITYQHLLRLVGARNTGELHDLGISAARQSPLEAFIQRREAARRRNQVGG